MFLMLLCNFHSKFLSSKLTKALNGNTHISRDGVHVVALIIMILYTFYCIISTVVDGARVCTLVLFIIVIVAIMNLNVLKLCCIYFVCLL